MKTIDALRNQVMKLRAELEEAETALAAALMADAPFKVGDRVRVITPQVRYTWNDDLLSLGSEVLPDKVEEGRVVTVQVNRGDLETRIAGDTKGGASGKREIHIAYDARIEKIDG